MILHCLIAAGNPGKDKWLRAILQDQKDLLLESTIDWRDVARGESDVVIVNYALIPSPASESIELVRALPDAPEVVVIGQVEPEEASQLTAAGCLSILDTTFDDEGIKATFMTLLERCRDAAWEAIPKQSAELHHPGDVPRLADFVSNSVAMRAFISFVERVVSADTSLLIMGETGVGKEHLARAIHAESPRSAAPFIAVNCAAFPEALLESELFGHQEGAFTSATRSRKGWFELAHHGTIFLDEIGELPIHLQVKLLRVLQKGEIQRLGSEKSFIVDVRIMTATNRDLEEEIKAKRFREDLYFRLSVVNLVIPPLRDRREDISTMVRQYVDYFRTKIRRGVRGITSEAMDALTRYHWPGNLRELINIVERGVLLSRGTRISLEDLPESISHLPIDPGMESRTVFGASADALPLPAEWTGKTWRELQKVVQRSLEIVYFSALLEENKGRVGEVAKRAGLDPRSLYGKLRQIGLRKEIFKESS